MSTSSLNIAIVYHGPFPWNRGIGQLYNLVEELGHKPIVLSAYPEIRYRNSKEKKWDTFHIRRSDLLFHRLLTFHFPLNLYWEYWLIRMCRQNKIDVLIVRETPLSYLVQKVARWLRIPAILDMRENLPEIYADRRSKRIPIPAAWQYKLASLFESFVLPKFDHIFTVSEELRKLVIDKYKVKRKNIDTIGNYPDRSYLEVAKRLRKQPKKVKTSTVKLVFAGGISENRGIQDIISALAMLPKECKPEFTIIGDGDYLKTIRLITNQLGMDGYVSFLPMLPPEELLNTLSNYDIGVCSYHLTKQTHHTMPGKLFEYMAAGLAILSSSRKPVKRILEDCGCGLIYKSSEPEVIAKLIQKMTKDRLQLREMGMRGQEAVINRYNYTENLKVLESVLVDSLQ